MALGGGALVIQGKASKTNSQRFNGLAVNSGSSAIVLTASTSNHLLLSLGTISRSPGGTLDFTLPSGTQSASNGITTTTANNSTGILGAYATVGGTNWASSSGGNITAYNAYTGGDLGTLSSNSALNVSPSGTQTAVTSANSYNTLNLTGSEGLTMTASGKLTLAGGGLIGNTSGSVSGGTLAGSASGELIVITPANLTIGSVIADNGGATALTMTGSGALRLTGSNTYSGPTTINQGKLTVNGWLANSAVTVNNGGILSGTGSLASVTLDAGGQLAPGDSQGVMHLSGSLSLAAGAKLDYDLDGNPADNEVSMPAGVLALDDQQFTDFNFMFLAGFGRRNLHADRRRIGQRRPGQQSQRHDRWLPGNARRARQQSRAQCWGRAGARDIIAARCRRPRAAGLGLATAVQVTSPYACSLAILSARTAAPTRLAFRPRSSITEGRR